MSPDTLQQIAAAQGITAPADRIAAYAQLVATSNDATRQAAQARLGFESEPGQFQRLLDAE